MVVVVVVVVVGAGVVVVVVVVVTGADHQILKFLKVAGLSGPKYSVCPAFIGIDKILVCEFPLL